MTEQALTGEVVVRRDGPPEGWREIGLEMSNFDGRIDEGLADALRGGQVYGRHAAWNFNGLVWFADGRFHEQVWRFHVPMRTHSADTLEQLMREVSDEWGSA